MRPLIAIVGLCALSAIGSAWFVNKYFAIEAHALAMRLWPPATLQTVEARRLRQIGGWFSTDCGHVRHHQDPTTSIACANESLQSRRPFHVAFEWVGIDSHGITGLAGNAAGEVYEVTTDEISAGGGIANSRPARIVTVTRCERAPVERVIGMRGDRILSCLVSPKPESDRE